jgi:hypothetical protein
LQGSQEGDRKKQAAAFASSFLPAAGSGASTDTSSCSFLGDRSAIVAGSSLSDVAENMQGVSMSCRRNLKKEKRQRNEVMARQFRKPDFGRFGRGRGGRGGGRGGGRAAAAQADEADSEWLDQIYGQHTIYRRDEGKPAMGATKEEAKTEEAATA